jgi:hypothetical protein
LPASFPNDGLGIASIPELGIGHEVTKMVDATPDASLQDGIAPRLGFVIAAAGQQQRGEHRDGSHSAASSSTKSCDLSAVTKSTARVAFAADC